MVSTALVLRKQVVCAVSLGNYFLTFGRNVPPSSPGLWFNSWIQKTCSLNSKTGLQLIKVFQCCHFQWVQRQRCHYNSLIWRCTMLSVSLVTQATRRLAVIIVALLTFKWTLWRTFHTTFSLCLSLSLSHTHTHTHTHTHRVRNNTSLQ